MLDDRRGDLAVAEAALTSADLPHAAHHLARCLTFGPAAEVRRALARLVAVGGDRALALVPLADGGVDWTTVALRAAILGELGRGGEAVPLMLFAQAAAPEEPLLAWVDYWLAAGAVSAALDLERFVAAAVRCAESESLRPAIARLVERVRQEAPPHGRLAMISARMARNLGELDSALAIATAAHERQECYWTALALAGAHLERGASNEALAWYRCAAEMPDADLFVRLDEGDLCLKEGRFAEALAAYERVLAVHPDEPWALPSARFVRAYAFADVDATAALEAMAGADDATPRAVALWEQLHRFVRS